VDGYGYDRITRIEKSMLSIEKMNGNKDVLDWEREVKSVLWEARDW